MKKVNIDIANFNLTFGKDEDPLLSHFEDFVYPAFTEKLVREKDGISYFFESVKLIETKMGIALTGLIIKDTILEVKSLIRDGELVETNKQYPSAPYSFFCIFLKNHRMILAPNQKGSPNLKSFGVTARNILKQYRKEENKKRREDKHELLPYFDLRVTGVPDKSKLLDQMKKVKKINSLKIRFYPLNGEDIDNFDIVNSQILSLREQLGSNTGSITFNSPENKIETAEFVEQLGDTVDATLNVTEPNGNIGKIKNDKYSEKIQLNIEGDQVIDKDREIIGELLDSRSLTKTSDRNELIYNSFSDTIRKLFR